MSTENDIYLRFVTNVIGPLVNVVESDHARKQVVLETIEKIKSLAANVESSLRDGNAGAPSMQPARNASEPAAVTALGKWLSHVRELNPRQRSIAREIEILRKLEDVGAGAVVALKQLIDHLIALGLTEKKHQAAVVTQISRLKKIDAVASEAQGFYSRTDGGADLLQKRRKSYQALCAPEDARKMASQ